MSDLNRKLKKLESKLNVDKEQRVVEIVQFCDELLQPDHTECKITTRYVRFDDIYNKREQQ